MKTHRLFRATLLLSLTLLFSSCGLLPGRVEFFQEKVQAIPEMSEAGVERQKQAAKLVAERTQAAKEAAILTDADISVAVPITEAAVVSRGLSVSLGPPKRPFTSEPAKLAAKLETDRAKTDEEIDDARDDQSEFVGKKIEGTGFFSFGYFTWLAICAGGVFLVYAGLKVAGIFYPPVGAGLAITERISSKLAAKGLSQAAEGVEEFKRNLDNARTYTNVEIKRLLGDSLMKKQDSEVQQLIRRLTPK